MAKKRLLTSVLCLLTATTVVVAQSAQIRATNFTTRDGLGSNVVNCGLQDRQGYLWFGTNHCLTRFDGHRFVNFYVEDHGERQIEGITHIIEDTTRNVLLMSGRDYRLLCFDLTRMAFVSAEGMAFPKDADDEKDEQKYIARAREVGIDRGNRTNRRHDLHYARLNDGREIFATIDNGFFVYAPESGQLRHYSSDDQQPVIESDYINGIMQDRTGGVWLLTTFAGIYRLDMGEESLRSHTLAPNIRSFAQLDDDHIAVADMEGRVFRYNPDTRESSVIFNGDHRAYALNVDSKGRLWVGTRGGGIWIIEELKNLKIKKIEALPARQIYDIKFSQGGTAWIATLDGGLIEGHEQPDGSFFFFPHLQGEKVHELDIDTMGQLWIATENGILRKEGLNTDTIFNIGKVVCICHAPNGTVWAGSNGYGLIKIENAGSNPQSSMFNLQFITVDDGLANNCVESVTCDKEGNVIVGTDQGISIVSSADGSVRNLYSSQGLRANTYNENAILRTDDGRVFLGCLTGLVEALPRTEDFVRLRTKSPVGRRVVSSPIITSIEVNDVPRFGHLNSKVELSHEQNNLCFYFSSFAYNDMSSVVYSYWLEGIDSDWRPSTKENQALYTNLTPGHYRLHVRSRLAGTAWSEETVCEVLIAQPWYWTWWARIIYLLFISLFVWYEWHQYQQRLSLRRQLDQRLTALYAVEVQQEQAIQEGSEQEETTSKVSKPKENTQEESKLEETAQQKAANQRNKDFLDKLDHLILQNLLQADLDVNYLAQEMCVSYSTLHRRIKSLTGMTANEYVRKHRLTKAIQMLRDGIPATEVSMQCGFNSPSYFTRCFKAEYGILPSEV